jgi:hypothetical protein
MSKWATLLRIAVAFGLGVAITGGALPSFRFLWMAYQHAGF